MKYRLVLLVSCFLAFAFMGCNNNPISSTNIGASEKTAMKNPLRENDKPNGLKKLISGKDIIATCGTASNNQFWYRFGKLESNGAITWYPIHYLNYLAYDRVGIAINSSGLVVIVNEELGSYPLVYAGTYDGNGGFNLSYTGNIPTPPIGGGNFNLHLTLNNYNEFVITYYNNQSHLSYYCSGYFSNNVPYWRQSAQIISLPYPSPAGVSVDLGGSDEGSIYAGWQNGTNLYTIKGTLNYGTDYSLSFNTSSLSLIQSNAINIADLEVTMANNSETYAFTYSKLSSYGTTMAYFSVYTPTFGSGGFCPISYKKNSYNLDCYLNDDGTRFLFAYQNDNTIYLKPYWTDNMSNWGISRPVSTINTSSYLCGISF
jgi:hypothetical protein